jgi:thiol-disulfide isomerase/thioredoxin
MKNLLIVAIICLAEFTVSAQTNIPSVKIKTLNGESFDTSNFHNDGKPIILSFWATWCKPCVRELSNIAEVYDEWVEETGVKLIAISIDDSRSMSRVAPLVNGKDWEYDVYVDTNSIFKRAMNVTNIPHTILLDGDGNIIWQHTAYSEGDEEELYEMLLKLNK